jgi:hypothetical protein
MSVSLMQLPPISRYYIRRLVQHTWEAQNVSSLKPNESTLDQAVDDLLGNDFAAQGKLAKLERLALLYQGLSSEGTMFRSQIKVVEQQVAELLGLQPTSTAVSAI